MGVAVGAGLPLVANLISIAIVGPAVPFAVLLPALLSGAVSYGVVTGLLAAGTLALARRTVQDLAAGPEDGDPLLSGGDT